MNVPTAFLSKLPAKIPLATSSGGVVFAISVNFCKSDSSLVSDRDEEEEEPPSEPRDPENSKTLLLFFVF